MTILTSIHKNRFQQISEKLRSLGSRESFFISAEALFYEVIGIARGYGNDLAANRLLADLKHLEGNQYRTTQSFFRKSSQREQAIKSFMRQLIGILTKSSTTRLAGA